MAPFPDRVQDQARQCAFGCPTEYRPNPSRFSRTCQVILRSGSIQYPPCFPGKPPHASFSLYFHRCVCLAGLAGQELRNLSPQDAVELALEEDPVLPAGRARVQAAEGMRAQATFRPNPRLYLQSENTRFASTDTPFRFSRETDNFAYASQVLEAPGKRQGRINFNGEVVRSREAEVELLRARIGQSVAAAYWAAVGAERTLDILRQTLKNFDETVQYHRDRVREGALARWI